MISYDKQQFYLLILLSKILFLNLVSPENENRLIKRTKSVKKDFALFRISLFYYKDGMVISMLKQKGSKGCFFVLIISFVIAISWALELTWFT